MADPVTRKRFEEARGRHFEPLCRKLGMIAGEPTIEAGFAIVSAAAGSLRVHFEYERGLCWFSVGSLADSKPLCSVEEIAKRFPRIRLLDEGVQRLSLDEQCAFLESRWNDLQTMFCEEHLRETRRWHSAAAAAYTRKFTGER